MKKHLVQLSEQERVDLKGIVNAKRMAAYRRRHAQMLLAVDQGEQGPAMKDQDVAKAFDCTVKTVERLRRRLLEQGLDATLEHGNKGSFRVKALDGESEAKVIALACGQPPEGRNRWTLRLLAEQAVALKIVESCSKSSVHRTLKKMNFSLI